jgi:hypothetical protein
MEKNAENICMNGININKPYRCFGRLFEDIRIHGQPNANTKAHQVHIRDRASEPNSIQILPPISPKKEFLAIPCFVPPTDNEYLSHAVTQ